MKALQIALSGSSGLIGSSLSRRLISAGHRVRPLSRPASTTSVNANGEAIMWDPQTGLTNPGELNGIDCVIHLAGRSIAASRWTPAEKQRLRDSRVRATQLLVDQICQLDSPPTTFISASATGIYGEQGSREVDETTPPDHSFLADLAADWESACVPLNALGIRVVHPRFGIVLSKAGGALAKMIPLFKLRLGGQVGSGNQFWNWIGLADCLSALEWMVAESRTVGAYNVVSPHPQTNAEFTRTLARALGVSAFLPVPAWILRTAVGEMADALLLCSCRAIPHRLQEAGFAFQHPNLDDCLQSLRNNGSGADGTL